MPTRHPVAGQPVFEHYSLEFADYFVMDRHDGVLTLRLHTDGGPARFNLDVHRAWGNAWREIGGDPANEVIIITGTGDLFLDFPNADDLSRLQPEGATDQFAYNTYYEGLKLIENFVHAIDVPTIAAINGPSRFHTEFALMADLTIATDDVVFSDGHFAAATAPGDGLGLALQETLGTKRAAYHLYTGAPVDAHTALELGLVNEIVPRDQIMDRAHELASLIMKQPRAARRFTHAIVSRPWRRRVSEDFGVQLSSEMLGISADKIFG
ncbi:enoyl-CoA hydratase/isomerase family protein [Leifsonia sp. NPDC102414]|uniref:enoyl-CoA hydratase/isomerase family protein n=1 Tax=Leifsonia sp. NPDC102414 TaxID=3364124 RepID=UPI00382E1D69